MRDDPEIGDDEGSEDQWMNEDTDDSSEINVESRLPGSLDCVAVVLETPFPDLRIAGISGQAVILECTSVKLRQRPRAAPFPATS